MDKNAYFQLHHKSNQLWLHVFPAEGIGKMFELAELMHYLDVCKINDYDTATLGKYYQAMNFTEEFLLCTHNVIAENEMLLVEVPPSGLNAIGRFVPPSTEGGMMSKGEILSSLNHKGVHYGICEEQIDQFLNLRKYCTDYELAVATLPIHGKDAEITYHFDTNVTSRPKMKEDGSVDYHQLGNIKPVKKGEILATLTPVDYGTPGKNVLGKQISAKKVRNKHLSFGRNIEISEDKLTIKSLVAGHVTLVDDMVMVSDVFEVPKDVDTATGDIEYSGTVEIGGSVLTGYKVKTDGDIIVNGVVEGAILEAGGNIVLKSGMQGASRGILKANGNIIAKFLENAEVHCEGGITCDAMMHCKVYCKKDINVTGKRGLITGGYTSTYGSIMAANVGSSMGTDTTLEILGDIEMAKRLNELEETIQERALQIKNIDQVMRALAEYVRAGNRLSKDQEGKFKIASANREKMLKELENMKEEAEKISNKLTDCIDVRIIIDGKVFSGVKIVIKGMKKIMHDSISHCEFRRVGADIIMEAL